MMKRIIACCDGTWNRPEKKENGKEIRTNVEIIYNCILPEGGGVPQVKFYESGVGSSTFNIADNFLGGIKGLGIDQRIKDIYSFISMNYEKGDDIYLFGFSRGAYTARSVAGLIRNCGILKPENISMVDMAYNLYRDRNIYTTPDSDFMNSFKSHYSIDGISNTPIKFVGVWDTVGSLGLPLRLVKFYNIEKYKFHDVKLSSYIENAYHAVAIDEYRLLFAPSLWEITKSGLSKGQNVEQRWFVGAHSNVGGGYPDTKLSDLALNWMMEKAKGTNLNMCDPSDCQILTGYTHMGKSDGILVNSRSLLFRLWFKKYREIGIPQYKSKSLNGTIQTNETIDDSVIERFQNPLSKYKPENAKDILAGLLLNRKNNAPSALKTNNSKSAAPKQVSSEKNLQ